MPLSIYLRELNRILKPGGAVNLGVNTVAKAMDQSVYINTDWGACLDARNIGRLCLRSGSERRAIGGTFGLHCSGWEETQLRYFFARW